MIVRTIPINRIESEWGDIVEALYPALRQDPTFSVQSLYDRLMAGLAWVCEVSDGASGYWVITLDTDGDDLVAWTTAIAGKIDGGPKQRVKYIRDAVAFLEQIMINAGVTAHRICGRDWSTILPLYLPYEGARNGLQKRLG
jgi:hypothetical protein